MKSSIDQKRRSFKGSVLYTVTLVMMVMLILMMTAIALAGAANKRAYAQYHDDQTTYTGRSIVESVVSTLSTGKENASLGNYIFEQLEKHKDTPVEVMVNNGNALPSGYGTIEKLTFEYAGVDNEAGYYINGNGYNIIKVTATVKMGNETTTYTQYVSGSATKTKGSGGSGGFIAQGGFSLGGSTSPSIHGPSFTGLLPTNLDDYIASGGTIALEWPDPFTSEVMQIRNKSVISGSALYNSSMTVNNEFKLLFHKNNAGTSGITVMGHIVEDNQIRYISNYTPSNTDSITNIPYVYCGGTYYSKNWTKLSNWENNNPINLYAGRVIFNQNGSTLYSSIFCYNSNSSYNFNGTYGTQNYEVPDLAWDEANNSAAFNSKLNTDSHISYLRGTETNLLDWASASFSNDALRTGSIYSKGYFKVEKKVNIKGNIYVDQLFDMSQIDNSAKIDGIVNVNGHMVVSNADSLKNFMKNNPTMKVKCGKLVDQSGNVISIDDAALTDVKDRITITGTYDGAGKAFSWPSGMEKDDILGNNSTDDQIVSNYNSAFGKFYDVTNQKFTRSINVSGLDAVSSAIYKGRGAGQYEVAATAGDSMQFKNGSTLDISSSCTLTGEFQNFTFNITPTADETWINLYDAKFNFCKFIIDDKDGKKVNFFIPQGGNYASSMSSVYETAIKNITGKEVATNFDNTILFNGSHILTKNYNDTYFNTDSGSLKTTLNLKTFYSTDDITGDNMVPDVNIYAADNVSTDDGIVHIRFENQCSATANIIAGKATFKFKNSKIQHNGSNFSYTPDGSTEKDSYQDAKNISFIGSIFIGEVEELQNDFEFYYVDYKSNDDDDIDGKKKYAWDLIDGFVTY